MVEGSQKFSGSSLKKLVMIEPMFCAKMHQEEDKELEK